VAGSVLQFFLRGVPAAVSGVIFQMVPTASSATRGPPSGMKVTSAGRPQTSARLLPANRWRTCSPTPEAVLTVFETSRMNLGRFRVHDISLIETANCKFFVARIYADCFL